MFDHFDEVLNPGILSVYRDYQVPQPLPLILNIHYSINHWSQSAYTTQGASLLLIAICLIGLQLAMYLLAQGNPASFKLLSP